MDAQTPDNEEAAHGAHTSLAVATVGYAAATARWCCDCNARPSHPVDRVPARVSSCRL